MAEVNLEIAGASGTISAHALQVGVQQTVKLLNEYERAMWEKENAHLGWNVRRLHSNGSLLIGFHSFLRPQKRLKSVLDNSGLIASNLVTGIATIDQEAITPPYISEVGMRRVDTMVNAIRRHEAKSFTITSDGLSASVTEKTGDNLIKLIEIKRNAIGSVEGRLVGINVAHGTKLSIIHHISKKSISCIVNEDRMEIVKSALGKRVLVHGMLHKNINGDTVRITVRDLKIFPPGSMRDQMAEISSLPLPDFAKTSDTEEYLRRSRGE
jgi:hypothetical protein